MIPRLHRASRHDPSEGLLWTCIVLLVIVLVLVLAGCSHPVAAIEDAGQAAGEVVEKAKASVPTVAMPVVDVVEAVAEAVPVPDPESAHPTGLSAAAASRITAHIVRWEVSSQAAYTRSYQGVICPPGASGPTWGIGYDGGHQSRATILRDWAHRDDVERLATTSGQTGAARCAAARAQLRDVRVPYAEAIEIFDSVSLPQWVTLTRRVYPGADRLPELAQGSLGGNTYNRGPSMLGSRAVHKRVIRDDCVPRLDVPCIATQLRAQCVIWIGTNMEAGLCARRNSEADLALESLS